MCFENHNSQALPAGRQFLTFCTFNWSCLLLHFPLKNTDTYLFYVKDHMKTHELQGIEWRYRNDP